MITRIEATNYRCFEDIRVPFSGFNLLVGANGSGKTTLLDIPCLLGEMLQARTVATPVLEERSGRAPRASSLQELFFRDGEPNFVLAVEAALPEEVTRNLLNGASSLVQNNPAAWPTTVRYELRFELFNDQLTLKNEYLFTFSSKDPPDRRDRGSVRPAFYGESPKRTWKFALRREYGGEAELRPEAGPRSRVRTAVVAGHQLALPRVQFESADHFPAARWMYSLLVEEAVFLDPDWDAARRASPPGLPKRLVANARNIPWLAADLRDTDPDRFLMYIEQVRVALPQVKTIDVRVREEDRHAYFQLQYEGDFVVSSSGLSDGTLHILTLCLLPYLLRPPRLLLVEEPENGIHPQAIEAVLQSLNSLYDTQVVVTSHSPVVLAGVTLSSILVARLAPNGSVEILPGTEHPRLRGWQGAVDLPMLFAAGILG